jgi:acetyl esterase/lipase
VYGKGASGIRSKDLIMDLYEPAGAPIAPRPFVVLIHSGDFRPKRRIDDGIVRIAQALADHGLVAATIDYRLINEQPIPSPRMDALRAAMPFGAGSDALAAACDDTLTAIEYLTANADRLRLDPGRIGIVGSSAGAITAAHVAYVLDDFGLEVPRIRMVGSLWGALSMSSGDEDDPLAHVEPSEAALFAVHGDADTTVPVRWSDLLVARADAEGLRTEYHRIVGGDHGFDQAQFFTATVAGGSTPLDRLVEFAVTTLS